MLVRCGACIPRRAGQTCLRTLSSSAQRRWSEDDYAIARKWHENLPDKPLPRLGEISYARSSGPGGQNVNKVNSKAQLRVPLSQIIPVLPAVLLPGLRKSRYYAAGSDSLLIQADESRKQAANKDACFRKLTELVSEVFRATVPGETSREQKDKVSELKTQYNEARIRSKKMLSNKKAARGRGFEN